MALPILYSECRFLKNASCGNELTAKQWAFYNYLDNVFNNYVKVVGQQNIIKFCLEQWYFQTVS